MYNYESRLSIRQELGAILLMIVEENPHEVPLQRCRGPQEATQSSLQPPGMNGLDRLSGSDTFTYSKRILGMPSLSQALLEVLQ